MTNPTGYPVIDGILESIAPAAIAPAAHGCSRCSKPASDDFCLPCRDYLNAQRRQVLNRKQAVDLTTLNGTDINARLDDLAHDLCYQSIRWSGLYKELTNDQWDALAERLRAQVRTFVEGEIDAELRRIEAEKETEHGTQ